MNTEYQKSQNNGGVTPVESIRKIAESVKSEDLSAAIAMLSDMKKNKEAEQYTSTYFSWVSKVTNDLSRKDIEDTLEHLVALKKRGGRLFFLGIGGSAGNSTHAVNDFRKIANIESYAPTDNVSELTARANDDGWDTIFSAWLKGSNLSKNDAVFVFSVGGGNLEKNISTNIVKALQYAKEVEATILGVVSRDGGYTRKVATTSILVPVTEAQFITPIAEAFQAVIWHLLATHPKLK
jgi:D-sedoheptulose 7-phosphate isomerase